MRRTALILSLLVAGAAGVPFASAAESKNWEFGGRGKWAQVDQPTNQPVANATLDKAEQLLASGNSSAALSQILEWIKAPANHGAPDRDRGLFLLAAAYYQEGDRIKAFYHLDELMDFFPESRFFSASIEKQYVIADAYLSGYKRKLLGMAILSADDEAIDMLYRIQERSPGSPLAERALRRSADYYFNSAQYDLAGDAYAAYARAYPRSPDIGRVKLQQAFASLAQFRGTRFDSTPLIDARTQFEEIKVRYPEIASQAEVQKFLDTINTTLAKKLIVTADFYRRTGKPKAAAYTLQTLLATYPLSSEAAHARAELAKLPASAVKEASEARVSEASTRPIGPDKPTLPPSRPTR